MRLGYILFTSMRYLKARRKSKGFASSVLSILGVTVGVMTLIGVLAVMNGFQLNYINNILEISSYHLQITAKSGSPLSDQVIEKITRLPGVSSVIPFVEDQVLVEGYTTQLQGGSLRGVPDDILLRDAGFREKIFAGNVTEEEPVNKDFNIKERFTVVIGRVLATLLRVEIDDYITLSSVSDISLKAPVTEENKFKVTGIFKSGYNEIDKSMLFISMDSAEHFLGKSLKGRKLPVIYGIKLKDHFQDLAVKQAISEFVDNTQVTVMTWREFNKGFFGALLMEKIMMMFLVGLIFIVVGFNILTSLRRMVYERIEEIGILKALGSSPGEIQYIFIFEGFLIGLLGGLSGMVLGLLIANHINEIFAITVAVANWILEFLEFLLTPFFGLVALGRVTSPFSPNVFYLKEVPSEVLLTETVIIFIFALVSSIAAAFIASRKVAQVKPVAVLRYE